MDLDIICRKCNGHGLVRIRKPCEECSNEKEEILKCIKCNNTGFILDLIECENCVGSGRLDDEWKKSLK